MLHTQKYSNSPTEPYPYFPVWVFVELISFGDLTYLTAFYDELYSDPIVNNKFMNTVRDMRNREFDS